MKRSTPIFTLFHAITSIVMMLALVWLTVSTPFVYTASQEQKKETASKSVQTDDTNPFSSTTEEKSESSLNSLSEFLHEAHTFENLPVIITTYYKCHPSDLYFAFHPELLIPPPKA